MLVANVQPQSATSMPSTSVGKWLRVRKSGGQNASIATTFANVQFDPVYLQLWVIFRSYLNLGNGVCE